MQNKMHILTYTSLQRKCKQYRRNCNFRDRRPQSVTYSP